MKCCLSTVQDIVLFSSNIVYIIVFIMGVMLLILNTKPNIWFGVRVPWTMRDEEIWKKTQAFSGKVTIIICLLGFILDYILKNSNPYIILTILIINILLIGCISVGYSIKIYGKKYGTIRIKKHEK